MSSLLNNQLKINELTNIINNLPEDIVDTSDATATSKDILGGKTAYINGEKVVGSMEFQHAKTVTPTKSSQTAVSSGVYVAGTITVGAIPSNYIVPSGTKTVTSNGTHDVKSYASVNVSVDGGGASVDIEDSLITGTINGDYTNDRVTTIGPYAFAECSNLTTVSFPAVTSIERAAFLKCYSLTTVSFPNLTSISSNVFAGCSNLITASFPAATYIGLWAFDGCSNLTTVSFPVATNIGSSAFHLCSNLTTASFPAATYIGSNAFYLCRKLTTVSFPEVTSIGNSAFYDCSSLPTVSFPVATYIGSSAFYRCYNLKSLYLIGSSVCGLSNSNAFTSTPIGGYSTSAGTYGSIYVPASLLASYKAATNWTYFSSRFVGI